jgi:arylsulfatase A-like enzyme
MVKWPGKVKPGTTSGLISVQYDLMATLSELTGIHSFTGSFPERGGRLPSAQAIGKA